MRLPTICGCFDRRILANFRVDPDALAAVLPEPFRPQVVGGYGIAGICLIRLASARPRGFPAWLGLRSENAAHRIAVEWDDRGRTRTGVFVPRRDTSSRLSAFAGGRVFPGALHRARFDVTEEGNDYRVAVDSHDGKVHVLVDAAAEAAFPTDSVFGLLDTASRFFEAGSLGYSPRPDARTYDGLELQTATWHVQPLAVRQIESSYFNDPEIFPPGSVTFDCALLMRGIDHRWQQRPPLCA